VTIRQPTATPGVSGNTDAVYRRLFEQLYQTNGDTVRLGKIMHWNAVMRDLDRSGLRLNQELAYLPRGYFYGSHTPAPGTSEIETDAGAALANGAHWLLYPAVRHPAPALNRTGFVDLPWFIATNYHVRSGLATDLRAQLGGRRHRELRRHIRLADEHFPSTVCYGRSALSEPGVMASFDRLHQLNLKKYGHRRNHYDSAALEVLLTSGLGDRLGVLLRHPRAGGPAVAATLFLDEPDGTCMHLLVQGIDHDVVQTGHNLYAASVLDLLEWGTGREIGLFDLGKSAETTKLGLGANSFHLLWNHLVPVADWTHRTGLRTELDDLRAAATARMRASLAALQAKVHRRGVAHLIDLPLLPDGMSVEARGV
jgi:hypothetical protein